MFEEAQQYIEELKRLSVKYQDYKKAMPSKIRFRAPQNDYEREVASKVTNRVAWIIGIGLIAFAATAVLAFRVGQTGIAIVCILVTLFLGYFFFNGVLGKAKVAYGVAVWKHYRVDNVALESSKTFFFSVIFDEPEKIIVRDLQTNREDFDKMVEGSRVMVIKRGGIYMAKIM